MKRIMIINPSQFGYQTSIFYLCKYLSYHFNITYLCWDFKKTKIEIEGIDVYYVSRNGNLFLRNLRFLKILSNLLKNNTYHLIFIKYFKILSSIIKILHPNYIYIIDIRSGSVEKNKLYRIFNNFLITAILKHFTYKTVISDGLARQLKCKNIAYILPLGAETISEFPKKFDQMNLFYIGTLTNRNIDQTVSGFAKFYDKYHKNIKMTYTIVGSGRLTDEKLLKTIIKNNKMDNIIHFVGPVTHTEVKPFFDSCNIGVSYIPMTKYFDDQPPSKTFEYLLSGMPVIATQTSENLKVINNINGILIKDTPDSFYEGLIKVYNNLNQYNSKTIIDGSQNYTWKYITNSFIEYVSKLI